MRVLLDTQLYLWFVADSSRLSKQARNKIVQADEVYISAASIWEISIKVGLGKLRVDQDDIVWAIEESGFLELPVSVKHAAQVATLPPYHRDPFDRMLIAQATQEPMRFLTADKTLRRYSDIVEIV